MRLTSGDLVAGLALAAVAIPEQLATARLAGVPPALGLTVFVAASLGFFVAGKSRFLSAGADSTIAPIFAGSLGLMAVAGSAHYLALAAGLALMVGAVVGLGGLFKLGWISRLLSVPVITGFLAGIAAHIALSQAPALSNPYALVIGLGVLAAAWGAEAIDIRIPGALIAAIAAALAVWAFGLADRGVAVLGAVTMVTPAPPMLAMSDIIRLIPIALIVSLMVMIQGAAVAQSFDGEDAAVNRDFVGLGLANILSGLAGGFAANASPPRTAIVAESGGQSRFAGLAAALITAAFLVFGLSLLRFLPQAALAGLLLFVAIRILRVKVMRQLLAQSPMEFALMAATALAIILLPIATGVGVGIGLSLLHGVWTIAQTRAVPFKKLPGTTIWWPGPKGESVPGILVAGFPGPLFFLNARSFRDSLAAAADQAGPVRAIILEASGIAEMDFSGAQMLAATIKEWKEKGAEFFIARLESRRADQALRGFGALDLIGENCIFHSVDDVIRHLERKP